MLLVLQSQFEKQVGGHAFDVLKVDGWRVLTLHSAPKIEEDELEEGVVALRRRSCSSLSPYSPPGCRPSSSLQLNDAALPSGRL